MQKSLQYHHCLALNLGTSEMSLTIEILDCLYFEDDQLASTSLILFFYETLIDFWPRSTMDSAWVSGAQNPGSIPGEATKVIPKENFCSFFYAKLL